MPQAVVKSFANKSGKSKAEVEKAINTAKKEAKDMGKSESKNENDYWQFVIGVAKKILGIDESMETHGAILAEAFALSGHTSYTEFENEWKKELSEEVTVSTDFPDLPQFPANWLPKDDETNRQQIPYTVLLKPERQEENQKKS